MEYQKTANLLNNESYQPSKFRMRNWIEINQEEIMQMATLNLRLQC